MWIIVELIYTRIGVGHLVYLVVWIVWIIVELIYTRIGVGHLVYLVGWIGLVIAGLTCSRIGGIKLDLSGGVDSFNDR